MGTDTATDRNGSGVRLHFLDLDPDLSFREKAGSGMYGMVYIECKVHVCK